MPHSSLDVSSSLERRLREGDQGALATLFADHRDRLLRLIDFRMDRRMWGRVDPEDVLQEAFLAASQRIEHFATNTQMSAFIWVRAIVLQTLIDVHRYHLEAKMRDADREVGVYSGSTPSQCVAAFLAGTLTSPSQLAEREELYQTVADAINDLDPLDQQVLVLRHFEELTNSETAEVLGIQQKAASTRYVRAVQRLKTTLAKIPGFFE